VREYRKPVIVVGLSRSWCAYCGRDALPHELVHETEPTFREELVGCGVRYTHVSTDYAGSEVEAATRAKRPDLPYIPFSEITGLGP
jgi:hypothetical protein